MNNDTIKSLKIGIYTLGDNIMKVKKLKISGIGGISELELNFSNNFNVICGANGIGKSTILDVIADSFGDSSCILKRNALYKEGLYEITFIDSHNNMIHNANKIETFTPENKYISKRVYDDSLKYINFGLNRNIQYNALNAIPRDEQRNNGNCTSQSNRGVCIDGLKGWFVNRDAYIDKTKGLTAEQKHNYYIAQKTFGLLDSNVQFDYVDPGTLDIMLETKDGIIYFEYLSAGYKTCVYIVLGIIREIEYRFKNPSITASDFDGVITIDEIDLHLHPVWQAKLINALKQLFPKAQFIVSTHSPSILQSLEANEIIALDQDENGKTYCKDLNLGEYGLQGWSLEEILKDVMGMPTTTSELYQKTIDDFDKAMEEENISEIKRNYQLLDKMLHPTSTLRTLLQIQMAGLEE